MITEEGFTKADLEYINEPFSKKDRDYIYTLDIKYFKKWTRERKRQDKKAITEK